MYKFYEVEIRIVGRICGGVPKHTDIIKAWVEARTGFDDEKAQKIIEETTAKMAAEKIGDEKAMKAWTGFKSDGGGLYVEARQVNAMLKESGNILKGIKGSAPVIAIRNLKARMAERVFVEPDHIYLGVSEPDGFEEQTIRVITPRGPRSAIKRFDFVKAPTLGFVLRVLDDGLITAEVLDKVLEHAQHLGIGANRSQGFGKFEALRFEEVER